MKSASLFCLLLTFVFSSSLIYAQNETIENTSATSTDGLKKTSLTVESIMAEEHYKVGVEHFEAKRFKEAVSSLKQAIRLKPEWSDAHYYLGQTYYSLNKYRDAAEEYKLSVKLKPDWAKARYRLGWAYYVLGKKQQAFEEYNALKSLDADLANSLYRIIKDPSFPNEPSTPSNKQSDSQIANDLAQTTTQDKAASRNVIASVSYPPKEPPAGLPKETAATNTPPANLTTESVPAKSNIEIPPTEIYRVGLNDILDIRLLNSPSDKSTLYRVMDNGTLDYPLAGGSLNVNGSTTEEIATKLKRELKRRSVHEDPQVMVTVREYASHSVVISGLVNNPGVRTLRREAVPLYVLLAEAQPRPEAGRATIIRANSSGITIDLNNIESTSQLVYPNDVINISAKPEEYYYIGGMVSSPGQKTYREGMTLMQAVLSAGGVSNKAKSIVEISRSSEDGKLSTTKYLLRDIKSGKEPDPRLQPADLIEVR
jgi:protein involved in polysaccharide export with SLBB domain